MEKLSREEVLHVAKLARLELSEEEIEKYSYQLKKIFDEINKINDIDLIDESITISPCKDECVLREDENLSKGLEIDDVLKNVPKKFDKFVEVRGVFDE